MDEVDTLALFSSMLEARTQEIASLKATEPTMRPMSINEMSQVAPKTYNFCQVCGIQGHYGYECSCNVYNSQSAPLEQMNSFEEGYGYNQCSYTFDQEWMDQSNFSCMDNGVQKFPYHDQQQFEQQYYLSYEQSLMHQYHNPQLEQEYLQLQHINYSMSWKPFKQTSIPVVFAPSSRPDSNTTATVSFK
ncbi:hypothetical protein POM88_008452 [Heracleum sosnowskyi]|uniref:Uncharacterized protein n=1 Tax=Heracleum sosnowskyi TaxID=360622 RepID=A0AAD8J6P6_9APIA|nr:hypothetical protein POM88_008452 [Heracleum sosnowskyi]